MKKILFLILVMISFSCGREYEPCYTSLSPEAKEINPYSINQTIKWENQNGIIIEGKITEQKTERFIPSTPGQECEMSDNEDYITTISFNNFIFNVKIRSTTTDKISYSFEQRENNYPKYVFDVYEIPVNAFTDFYFKNVLYLNAIVAHGYSGNDEGPRIAIFSKEKGIEYVQYSNTNWYKRVD